MARGRFIEKEISLNEKVAALSDDTARLLYTWLILHLDCEGRFYGEPHLIKGQVFPRNKCSVARVDKYLKEMEQIGLLVRYFYENSSKSSNQVGKNQRNFQKISIKEQYLFMPNFEKHQVGLRKDKESPSVIPPPQDELNPSILPTKDVPRSGKGKLILIEDNINININKTAALFAEHREGISKLRDEFPELANSFDHHVINCKQWWIKSGRTLKDPVKAVRNWLIKERDSKSWTKERNFINGSIVNGRFGQVPTSNELDQEDDDDSE